MKLDDLQITQTVTQLLERAGVKEPPIPVERIAHMQGALIRYEPFEGDLSGLLFREQNQIVIGVNALHSKTRQRFTIAHELGHLALHNTKRLHIDRDYRVYARDGRSSQADDPIEIAANAFAAALLMPSHMLRSDLQDHAIDLESDTRIQELADRYKVSVQAMTFRLINLGFILPLGQ